MTLRFRKTINLGGVKLNVSKTGISLSLPVVQGLTLNLNKKGLQATLNARGTGVSFTTARVGRTIDSTSKKKS